MDKAYLWVLVLLSPPLSRQCCHFLWQSSMVHGMSRISPYRC